MLRPDRRHILLLFILLLVPCSARELPCLLQGGLIDLRYGQASVDTGGTGILLQWDDQTRFTLDGISRPPADLTGELENGTPLKVVTSYHLGSGLMTRCDALSPSGMAAVDLTLKPWVSVLKPAQRLAVVIDGPEARRLGLTSPTLRLPGLATEWKLKAAPHGSFRTTLEIGEWNLRDVPLLVYDGGRVFRSKTISVSSTPPEIGETGPDVASDHLDLIPGWFSLEGNLLFVEPRSIRLEASNGVDIVSLTPRRDRVDFALRAAGPGNYRLKASVADQLGRTVEKSWIFTVRR